MELSPTHELILAYLQTKGKATPAQIAKECSLEVSEAEARAAELVRQGLLRGVPSDNMGFVFFMRPSGAN